MDGMETRKSDGADGNPLIPGLPLAPPFLPEPKQNAALREPAPAAADGVDPAHPCRGQLAIVDAARGVVQERAPDGSERTKIAICGFASSTRKYIAHIVGDPSWSIWGLNQLYRHIGRADRWFDIHHNWDSETVPGTDHRAWAKGCGIPFYTQELQPDVPTSVRFPIDAVIGIYQVDYFTSTPAYMLALAMMEIDAAVSVKLKAAVEKATKAQLEAAFLQDVIRNLYGQYTVGIFGIDLVVGGEYFHEKPCAEFWVGALSQRGIRVVIPPESALCKQRVRYGCAEPPQILAAPEVSAHKAALIAERDEQLKKLYMLEGSIVADERWEQVLELRQRGATVG